MLARACGFESHSRYCGGMAERSKAADLKPVGCNSSVGSNPTSSAYWGVDQLVGHESLELTVTGSNPVAPERNT